MTMKRNIYLPAAMSLVIFTFFITCVVKTTVSGTYTFKERVKTLNFIPKHNLAMFLFMLHNLFKIFQDYLTALRG